MKRPCNASLSGAIPALLALLTGPALPAAEPTTPESPSVVTLSPFEVNSSKDVGYLAKDTLAGSRLNTSLKDVAAQVSIMTPEFLQDVGAVTMDDAFRLDALKSDSHTSRKPNFDWQERIFATVEAKPFKWISARAYVEDVHRDRTPVRNTVITDAITSWINAGKPIFDNGVGRALPANVNTPGLANYNPAFQPC